IIHFRLLYSFSISSLSLSFRFAHILTAAAQPSPPQAMTSGYRTACFYDRQRCSSSPPLSTPGLQKLKNSMGDFAIKSAPVPFQSLPQILDPSLRLQSKNPNFTVTTFITDSEQILESASSPILTACFEISSRRNTNNPAAKRKFQEIRDAYEMSSSQSKRKRLNSKSLPSSRTQPESRELLHSHASENFPGLDGIDDDYDPEADIDAEDPPPIDSPAVLLNENEENEATPSNTVESKTKKARKKMKKKGAILANF
ncbi:hypothetical protein V2J09_021530, partial [Rumex salicifolius]